MGVFTNHTKVLKHACPTCEAVPGEECRDIFGVHNERWHIVFPPRLQPPRKPPCTKG